MNTAQVFDKYAHQLQVAIGHYAPQAYAIAIQVKRLDCIGTLIMAAVQVLLAILICVIMCCLVPRWYDKADWDRGDGFCWLTIGGGISGFISGIIGLSVFGTLLDRWLWIGAFYPQLALAHDLISKALGQ